MNMNSQQVKQAFAAAGIKVRVADLGGKFRICRMAKPGADLAHDLSASRAVAASLGLFDTAGRPGGQLNQKHEMLAYEQRALITFGIVVSA